MLITQSRPTDASAAVNGSLYHWKKKKKNPNSVAPLMAGETPHLYLLSRIDHVGCFFLAFYLRRGVRTHEPKQGRAGL